MASINVVVVATAPDIQADGIAAAVAERADMTLVGGRVLLVEEAIPLIQSRSLVSRSGVVLVGPDEETGHPAERFFAESSEYVVVRVAAPVGDVVRMTARRAGLQEILTALRILVDHGDVVYPTRVARLHSSFDATVGSEGGALTSTGPGSLLDAAIGWIHETFRHAASALNTRSGDLPGLTLAGATLIELLDCAYTSARSPDSLTHADHLLTQAYDTAGDVDEPLALIASRLALSAIEFRLLLLALAPELNPLYQRCTGVLLDDLGRRVGTLGLYASLLGEPAAVRLALGVTGNFARWRLLENQAGLWFGADEPLRLDAALVSWILGERDALARDPGLRPVTRRAVWAGAALIDFEAERFRADTFVDMLQASADGQLMVFPGEDVAGWRALLELGAAVRQSRPIRIDAAQLSGAAIADAEEYGIRAGRVGRLTGAPLIIDLAGTDVAPETERPLSAFFSALAITRCRAGVICPDVARLAKVLGSIPFVLMEEAALSDVSRARAFSSAAKFSGARLSADQARSLMLKHPLHVDGFARAMAIARSAKTYDSNADQDVDRFIAACKEVAAEGLSHFAQRIEPMFALDDVVLPADRKQQLYEIVDNVQLADRVLVDWKFGDRLPYGRGVAALFHGPSGTGKTMAALAVARQLHVQVLRIDLSRVVSKYIGDTEKNIDRVFQDARRSGAALLFDEAEALLGKRSEVKDAHDRYANIEVAYLLQQIESFEGLAILTTNLWQNVDPAFLRRLRFIVDFPRPDAVAREAIWRQCLPENSHVLDTAAFRLLARKIDLTGGHISQITLRAAFVAAALERRIEFAHIAYAANAELAKVGQQPIDLDAPVSRRVA